MHWFRRLMGQHDEPVITAPDEDLEKAQQQRQEAEAKLAETRRMTPQVNAAASTLRRLRQDNHFSARIADAFGRLNE